MNDEIADTLVSSVRLCQFVDKLSVNYSELLYFANVFWKRLNSIHSNKLCFNFITISHFCKDKAPKLVCMPSPSDKTTPSGWWKVVISKETLLAHQSVTFFSKASPPSWHMKPSTPSSPQLWRHPTTTPPFQIVEWKLFQFFLVLIFY